MGCKFLQTKRNPRNAKAVGRAQDHWRRVLSKQNANRFIAKQKQKRNTGKQFTKDCSAINFNWHWW